MQLFFIFKKYMSNFAVSAIISEGVVNDENN